MTGMLLDHEGDPVVFDLEDLGAFFFAGSAPDAQIAIDYGLHIGLPSSRGAWSVLHSTIIASLCRAVRLGACHIPADAAAESLFGIVRTHHRVKLQT